MTVLIPILIHLRMTQTITTFNAWYFILPWLWAMSLSKAVVLATFGASRKDFGCKLQTIQVVQECITHIGFIQYCFFSSRFWISNLILFASCRTRLWPGKGDVWIKFSCAAPAVRHGFQKRGHWPRRQGPLESPYTN